MGLAIEVRERLKRVRTHPRADNPGPHYRKNSQYNSIVGI